MNRKSILKLIATLVLTASPAVLLADATEDLYQLFDAAWERQLEENPTLASSLGDKRYNQLWPDVSLQAIALSHAADQQTIAGLGQIDRAALSASDQINYDLFGREYSNRAAGYKYRQFLIPLNQRGGIQTADQLAQQLRFAGEQDYEDWNARLRSFPEFMNQTITLMRQGVKEGRIHPSIILERVPDQIAAQIVDDPTQSPFYAPYNQMPETIPAARQEILKVAARTAISEQILPSFKRFRKFFDRAYLPKARTEIGASALPNGNDFYEYRVRLFTTTTLTSDEIHQIGVSEVKRIRTEMMKIIAEVEFDGTFDDFLEFLRTDPQFYYDNPDDLYQAYLATSKRIDPELVNLFGRMPRMPYGVKPIPDQIAPDTTTAYYSPPAADGSRAGFYYVNLYRPDVRPKYEIEVLSVHEAVPGHHFQISLAQELGDLPNFRRYGGFTAFVEGWGLYSESLGGDLGLYTDPYSKFGQLTYEMWRAVRLVVDTGMHSKGWSREKAIEFFKANAAKTEHDIVNEIDRYIAWPGQALAYKIGELKIKQLRATSERALGEAFDIRAFHDVVLGSGAVPLDVLETQIDAWIASVQQATAMSQ